MAQQKQTVFNNIRGFVQKTVNSVIGSVLRDKTYNVNDAQGWCNQICDQTLNTITKVNKNFKLIANCIVMQKADCGLSISGSCFWDNEVDGTVTIKHDISSILSCDGLSDYADNINPSAHTEFVYLGFVFGRLLCHREAGQQPPLP